MNPIRLIFAAITAFIFIFAFEFVYHGIFLKPQYEETMALWRTPEQMMLLMPIATTVQFGFAFLLSVIFATFAPQGGAKQGLRFGALAGLMIGLLQLGAYVYLPIPLELASAWFAGYFFETLGAGMIIGAIYKKA